MTRASPQHRQDAKDCCDTDFRAAGHPRAHGMRQMLQALALGCVSFAGSQAHAAEGTFYDCTVSSPGARGWIAPRIIFAVENSKTRAMVLDGIIQSIREMPLPADVSVRNNDSVRVRWTVEDFPVSNVRYKEEVTYIATLFQKTGRIVVTAELQYADNQPRGEGTCTVEKRQVRF